MAGPVTHNLTILLTDIKGFTDKTSHRSRADIQFLLDKHKEIVLPVLEAKGGRLIKTIGDAFLMVFESPTDAVLAGMAVQEALGQYNADKAEDDRIEIRIAINLGEVNLTDNDIYGEPVNITARIESVAQAGEVFFTEAVYLAMNKTEVPSAEVGLLQLKGIAEKVRVYKVKKENPLEARTETAPQGRKNLAEVAAKKGAFGAEPPPKAVILGAAAPSAARPKMSRRAMAVLIDLCLCGIVVGMFSSKDRTEVRIKKDMRPKSAVSIGKQGIKVSEKDVKVNIGFDGIEVSDGSEEKEDEVYNEGGWSVRTIKKKKAFPFFALAWFVYSLVFVKRLGTTPGGKICRLTIVQVPGGAPMDRRQNFTRAFFSVLSGYCAGLGYFWALFDKDGRGWHDLMAGTKVVSEDPA